VAGCAGIKQDGTRCKGIAGRGSDYCPAHDPDRSDARRRNASKAARSRPSRDLLAVRSQLQELADGVLAGEVDRANASVAGQLLNIKLRTVEVERRLHETQELEKRLEELEESLSDQRRGA
jgi:hypothetical protein